MGVTKQGCYFDKFPTCEVCGKPIDKDSQEYKAGCAQHEHCYQALIDHDREVYRNLTKPEELTHGRRDFINEEIFIDGVRAMERLRP
jgi:hypothetical protein